MKPARGRDRDDQRRSEFTLILERFVQTCFGCLAAVLVDEEGEAVDFAGTLSAYEAKLAGAHWQIVLRQLVDRAEARASGAGRPQSVSVRTRRRGYLVHRVFGDYVLVVICLPSLLPALSARALSQVEDELRHEAGWPPLDGAGPNWRRVAVRCDRLGMPASASRDGRDFEPLEVRARAADVGAFERGYSAVTREGRHFALVREPTGFWYACDRGD